MKNLFRIAMSFALAAVALTACQKEIEQPIEEEQVLVSSQVSFYAEAGDPATRATLTTEDNKSFKAAWEETDQVSLYATNLGSFTETKPATWDSEKGCFDAEFETTVPTDPGTWMYEAKYPYTADGTIPFGTARVQNGNAYNSAYDVMYGTVDYDNALLGKDNNGNVFVIPMHRLTGIAYFNITDGPDEDVVSATLEATGIAAESVTIASDGSSVTPSTTLNSITITFAEGTAPKASGLKLWFNVLPGSYSGLKLTINTATKTAVLNSNKQLTYTAGKLNKAVLNNLTWNDKTYEYVKVNSTSDLEDGAYLIVYEDGSLAFNGGLATIDVAQNTIAVEIDNDEILSTPTVDAACFVISRSGDNYFIQTGNGSYIGKSSYANGIDISSNGLANVITITDGDALIATAAGTHLRFNKTSGQERFRYFKDKTDATSGVPTQEAIALYKYNGTFVIKQPADLSFSETEFEITVGESFSAPTLNNPHELTISYNSDNEQVATVNATSGQVSLTGNVGTATITASSEGNSTYNPGSASYTITVKAAPVVMQTLAALKEFSTTTEQETEIQFNNVIVTWTNGTRAYIEDETAGMYVYGGVTSDLKTGDVLNGLTSVKVKVYNGQNEITAVTGTALSALKTTSATVNATVLTLAQAVSDQGLEDYENMRVEIKNTTISVDGTKKYLSDGNGNQIQLFTLSGSGASITDLNAGDMVSSAIGYPMNFKSNTPELIIVSTNDIVASPAPVVTVSNTPEENVSAEGAEVTVSYSIANPISGVSVEPSANVSWINSFVIGDNTIKFTVDANSGEDSEERTGKVTVAYEGAVSVTFDVIQSGNKVDTKEYFVKVTSTPTDLTEGTYLIVYENGSLALTGSGEDKNSVQVGTSVTIENGRIEATDAMKAISVSFINSVTDDNDPTILIKLASGKYIYNTSDANNMSVSTEAYAAKYVTSVAVSTGTATIISSGSYLRYNNATTNGSIFRFYRSSSYTNQQPVALYRLN